MVRGDDGVMTCSSGICLPGDYNKMNLPGKKPLRVDAQMYLMEVYEVEKYSPPVIASVRHESSTLTLIRS